MPSCAWPVCVFKCPHLSSSVDACLYLPSPMHVHTCPCLLFSALTCSRLHLPMPAHTTPALTCSCPYLLIPALTCPCPYLLTPAHACSHYTCPHLSIDKPVKAPPPPMSFRITSCFPATLGLLFLLFQRLLPHLSPGFLPVIPEPHLGMTLLCARERNLS